MAFMLILMALIVGYDQWRIEQLRSEVAAISGKIHVGNDTKSVPEKQPDLMTSLAQIERHVKNSQDLLKKKNVAAAQAELNEAQKKINSAYGVSKDIVGDTAQFLGKARDNAVKVFQKAWTDISEDSKAKK